MPAARISLVLGVPEAEIYAFAEKLAEEYESGGRGIRLVKLDKSLQLCSAPQYAKQIARVIEHRAPPRLSPPALETLADGDRILVSEGCTHHRQCNDIGTVKLPGWIEAYTGKKPEFDFTSGTGFERDLSRYHMVVHCGGCILNEQEMQYRLGEAAYQGVPMTNYGILIAYMKGILKRSLKPFPEVAGLLDEQGRLTDGDAGNSQ